MNQKSSTKLCKIQTPSPVEGVSFSFVLLAYRNHRDLEACLESIGRQLNRLSYNVIVVDSYHTDHESALIKTVADSNGASYVSIPNKGYGYGNNVGIKRALAESSNDFVVVCNPDTEIKSIDIAALLSLAETYGDPSKVPYIIAPQIKTLNGKDQNPFIPSKCELYESLVYQGCKARIRGLSLAGFALNRIKRELFLRTHSNQEYCEVYAPHGSFILFSNKAAGLLNPVFDERIFLFAEEHLVAWRAAQRNIPIVYCPAINVLHKEDGSVRLLTETNEIMRKSSIYVYEKTHGLLPGTVGRENS